MTRRLAVVLVAAAVGLAVGALLRPAQHRLPDAHHGDRALAERVRELAPQRASAVATAVVTTAGGRSRTASIGAPLDGEFELGSVTKAITGLLYADAIERREVRPATNLGSLLDLGDAPAGPITLEQLSQHRSGLPRVAQSGGDIARSIWSVLMARNPYVEDAEGVTRNLRATDPEQQPAEPAYSNFGFQALGHALAAATDHTYAELVGERIAEPLGLSSLTAPLSEDDLTPRAVTPRDAAGREQQPWLGEGIAPAGGLRINIADAGRLVAALLSGDAPGMNALDPVADFKDDVRIGAGWMTTRVGDRTITFHDGGTGGFRAWLGLDREAGVGVVMLGSTTDWLDDAGEQLLLETVRGQR